MGERDRLGMENRDMQNYISKLASGWIFSIYLYIVLILRKRDDNSDI